MCVCVCGGGGGVVILDRCASLKVNIAVYKD